MEKKCTEDRYTYQWTMNKMMSFFPHCWLSHWEENHADHLLLSFSVRQHQEDKASKFGHQAAQFSYISEVKAVDLNKVNISHSSRSLRWHLLTKEFFKDNKELDGNCLKKNFSSGLINKTLSPRAWSDW